MGAPAAAALAPPWSAAAAAARPWRPAPCSAARVSLEAPGATPAARLPGHEQSSRPSAVSAHRACVAVCALAGLAGARRRAGTALKARQERGEYRRSMAPWEKFQRDKKKGFGNRRPPWETEEDLDQLMKRLEQKPVPDKLPNLGRRGYGGPNGVTDEELEAIIDRDFPRRDSRNYNLNVDNPLTKGIEVMCRPHMNLDRLICCRGCGIPLQTHDPENVGYVRFAKYLERKAKKQHRNILCTRCMRLDNGQPAPIVLETLGKGATKAENANHAWGAHVVPAETLAKQLKSIRERRCLVVYVIDICDVRGSYMRGLREMIGKNGVVIVGTKMDLLPQGTSKEDVKEWMMHFCSKRRLNVLDVALVSGATGDGVNDAAKMILARRRGLNVFCVGAANAGKSMFIQSFLPVLGRILPWARTQECTKPMVSSTPGTTLGIIQLKAFRSSEMDAHWASLFDTPGIHQPQSMQNLVPIDLYEEVQPNKAFAVRTVCPARDVVQKLKSLGHAPTAANVKQWISSPVRYIWGARDRPIVTLELSPPISSIFQLSFIGVENLTVECEPLWNPEDPGQTFHEPPEDLHVSGVYVLKTPRELTLEGDVIGDVAISGLGWIAVTAKAMNQQAVGSLATTPQAILKVYGPEGMKSVNGECAFPIHGLPGMVKKPVDAEAERLDQDDDVSDLPPAVADMQAAREAATRALAPPDSAKRPSWMPALRASEALRRRFAPVAAWADQDDGGGDEDDGLEDEGQALGAGAEPRGSGAFGGREDGFGEEGDEEDDDEDDDTLRRPAPIPASSLRGYGGSEGLDDEWAAAGQGGFPGMDEGGFPGMGGPSFEDQDDYEDESMDFGDEDFLEREIQRGGSDWMNDDVPGGMQDLPSDDLRRPDPRRRRREESDAWGRQPDRGQDGQAAWEPDRRNPQGRPERGRGPEDPGARRRQHPGGVARPSVGGRGAVPVTRRILK